MEIWSGFLSGMESEFEFLFPFYDNLRLTDRQRQNLSLKTELYYVWGEGGLNNINQNQTARLHWLILVNDRFSHEGGGGGGGGGCKTLSR